MAKNSKFYCTKCGSNNIRVRWHKGGYKPNGTNYCGRYDANSQDSEHLHYYCECCLFDWVGPVLGMLKGDICRCHDDGCPEKDSCARYVFRNTGHDQTPHAASLFPYDQPLGEPCPLRIEIEKDKKQNGKR